VDGCRIGGDGLLAVLPHSEPALVSLPGLAIDFLAHPAPEGMVPARGRAGLANAVGRGRAGQGDHPGPVGRFIRSQTRAIAGGGALARPARRAERGIAGCQPRRVPRERAGTMARWMRPLMGRLWTSYGHVRRHIAFAGHLTRPSPPDISILTSNRLHGRRLCWRMAPDPPGAAGRT